MKPFLVGENNPYGDEPEFALYPAPRGCAGWRLCHLVLRMDPDKYVDAFERRNLLSAPKWSAPAAREAALHLRAEMRGTPAVLLGARVCAAFGFRFEPFSICDQFALLPHPSGLARAWHEPGAFERARTTVRDLVGELPA